MPNRCAVAVPGCPLGAIHHVPVPGRKIETSVRESPSKSNSAVLRAAWLTVTTWEPMLIVAVRVIRVMFGWTLKTSSPSPVCGCDVIWIQLANVEPCHEHPPPADTFTFPIPPCDAKFIVDWLTASGQPDACWIWNERVDTPFVTSIVPVRAGPWLAATVKVIAPLPAPLVLDVIVINESVVDAVHAHPVGCVMLKPPLPPPTGNATIDGEIPTRQALVDDWTERLHVPAMLPKLAPFSLTTYNRHTPFGAPP